MVAMIKNICCIGGGTLGGPSSCVIAMKCPNIMVHIVDTDEIRIQQWNSESLPFFEPGLDHIVKECRGKNLFFSNNINDAIGEADLIFISVNTPTKLSGSGKGKTSDLKYIEATARNIAEAAKGHTIIVEKSLYPVRAAENISHILTANARHEISFQVLSNPHFSSQGTAIQDILKPDRILIGGDESSGGKQATDHLVWLYSHWVPQERIITINTWESELSKLVSNVFLAQRISSINAISALCEATGADISQIASVVGQDSRIGTKNLTASLGFGGVCFENSLNNIVYMAEILNLHEVAMYWQNVLDMNEYQKNRFTKKIVETLGNTISNKKIAIFGISFKNNTTDMGKSPAIHVCSELFEEGAILNIYDPKVPLDKVETILVKTVKSKQNLSKRLNLCQTSLEATVGVHAIIVLSDWHEFKTYDYKKIYENMYKPAFIFDGRNILDHTSLLNIGFHVKTIGKRFSKVYFNSS